MFSRLSKIKRLASAPEVDDVCPIPQRTLAQALRDGPVVRHVHFRASTGHENVAAPRPPAPPPSRGSSAPHAQPRYDEEGLEMARIEIVSISDKDSDALDNFRVLAEDQKASADRGIAPPSPTASMNSMTQSVRRSTTQSSRKNYAFTYSA